VTATAATGPDGDRSMTRHLHLDRPAMLGPILNLSRRGGGDPTHRRLAADLWLRATRTPNGPVLLKLLVARGTVSAKAWGDGATVVRAETDADNLASRRVLLRAGFAAVGRDRYVITRPSGR